MGTDAQHAVLALQHYFDAWRNMVRNQCRHADSQIYVETIAQFAGDATYDALAFFRVFASVRLRSCAHIRSDPCPQYNRSHAELTRRYVVVSCCCCGLVLFLSGAIACRRTLLPFSASGSAIANLASADAGAPRAHLAVAR